MSHKIALCFASRRKANDRVWVGDENGGVWMRVVVKAYRHELLGGSSGAFSASMHDAFKISRDDEVLANTVVAAKPLR